MILLIAFAIVGAALGAYMRPRPVAVVVALVLGGAARAGLSFVSNFIEHTRGAPAWLVSIDDVIGAPGVGYLALIATCGGAAFFAALLCLAIDHGPAEAFWMPKEGGVRLRDRTGRYRRVEHMVGERAQQSAAEARIKAAFDR